jgi:ABC-2 type transport system permease protein
MNGVAATWMAFGMGIRKGYNGRLLLVGTSILLVTLVISYSGVLRALPADDLQRVHLDRHGLIWYLVLTQAATIGIASGFQEFEQLMREGGIEIHLLRPLSYWPIMLAEMVGQQCPRIVAMLALALGIGTMIVGAHTWRFADISILAGYLGILVLTLSSFMIVGSSSVWIGDSRPVFWIYQKLVFMFGGLLWPLAFYPAWLQAIAWKTPFPAMVAVVGEFGFSPAIGEILHLLAMQLFWVAVFLGLCSLSERVVRHRITRGAK